jgi:hypothetical protein
MNTNQIKMLRSIIKQEIEAAGINGMEHGVWGWAERQLDESWAEFQESFTNEAREDAPWLNCADTPLSPAAQAVLDACQLASIDDALTTAAVLRTTAHQIFNIRWKGRVDPEPLLNVGIAWACDALHALANELEAQ